MSPIIVPLLGLVLAECFALYHGQRRLFWYAVDASGSYIIAYILAMPGTVLHETAHYLTCLVLRVSARRPTFFRPERDEETGSVTLGSVAHAETDPLRQALISIAPALLVPPLFLGLTTLLLGTGALGDLPEAVAEVPIWRTLIWLYVAFSCGQAAFPSPGDYIGIMGGIALLLLALGGTFFLWVGGGSEAIAAALRGLALLLLMPALTAALSLGLFALWRRRKAAAF